MGGLSHGAEPLFTGSERLLRPLAQGDIPEQPPHLDRGPGRGLRDGNRQGNKEGSPLAWLETDIPLLGCRLALYLGEVGPKGIAVHSSHIQREGFPQQSVRRSIEHGRCHTVSLADNSRRIGDQVAVRSTFKQLVVACAFRFNGLARRGQLFVLDAEFLFDNPQFLYHDRHFLDIFSRPCRFRRQHSSTRFPRMGALEPAPSRIGVRLLVHGLVSPITTITPWISRSGPSSGEQVTWQLMRFPRRLVASSSTSWD